MSKPVGSTRLFLTEVTEQQKKEKKVIRRPFTPIHNSLFSKQDFDADPESLFRQLCALHWLLESLTLEPFSAMRPVTTCWNIRDPGGCKISLKRINREKDVEVKWEQFITPGKPKKQNKLLRSHYLHPRKASFLSISRFSAMSSAHTPIMGSISSLYPSSDGTPAGANEYSDAPHEGGEDLESTANSSFITHGKQSKEEEEPLSDYMQTLVQMIAESVSKDLDEEESQRKNKLVRDSSVAQVKELAVKEEHGSSMITSQRPKSSPVSSLSPTSHFIKKKSSTFSEIREMFLDVADEAVMSLHDKVENIERRRREFSAQKYRSLDTISHFHQDLEKMRQTYHHVKEEKDYTDTQNWFGVLLSRIPSAMRKKQNIENILNKLEKLEEKQFIRIRPNTFLKVLDGLRSWELCSPEISVAIEFVREHLVQMPLEDYTKWLQARLAFLQQGRIQSAPPVR
ncbi:coiled-coil domain-containing protein 60 [Discoglossus pictus]